MESRTSCGVASEASEPAFFRQLHVGRWYGVSMVGVAELGIREYVRRTQVPAAAYNQAVLLDALGERYEALAWYDHALELGYQDYYASARAACARRIADAEALLPYPPPAALAR